MKKLILYLSAISLLLFLTSVMAANEDAQIDITMAKITNLFKAGKESETLPYFAQIEAMNTVKPERFYYYYVVAESKAGDFHSGNEKGELYLRKFGKSGRYYAEVIQMMGDFSLSLDKENAAVLAKKAKSAQIYATALKVYQDRLTKYEADLENCPQRYQREQGDLESYVRSKIQACQQRFHYDEDTCSDWSKKLDPAFERALGNIERNQSIGEESWCREWTHRPEPPANPD
jgi:hypothetical protein